MYINSIRDKVLENPGLVSWLELYQTSRALGRRRKKNAKGKLEARSGPCLHAGFTKEDVFASFFFFLFFFPSPSFSARLQKHKWAETLLSVVCSPCLSAVSMNRLTSKHWTF